MNETTIITDPQGFELVTQLANDHFVLAFVILLLAICFLYVIKGQWITALMFAGFGVVLGAAEAASVYFTGETVSANHWYMDQTDPGAGMVSFLLLLSLLLIIVFHLGKHTLSRWKNPPPS